MAVQLHARDLTNSAVTELKNETPALKDRAANRAAVQDALDAADLRPGTGALFTAVGLQVRVGNLAAAERTATRATEREPDNFATWLTLGVVRQARHETAAANAAFARVKKLNPLYRTPQ
jgi:Flp pilus assembly protein TadD